MGYDLCRINRVHCIFVLGGLLEIYVYSYHNTGYTSRYVAIIVRLASDIVILHFNYQYSRAISLLYGYLRCNLWYIHYRNILPIHVWLYTGYNGFRIYNFPLLPFPLIGSIVPRKNVAFWQPTYYVLLELFIYYSYSGKAIVVQDAPSIYIYFFLTNCSRYGIWNRWGNLWYCCPHVRPRHPTDRLSNDAQSNFFRALARTKILPHHH